jgi:hypothetical protein
MFDPLVVYIIGYKHVFVLHFAYLVAFIRSFTGHLHRLAFSAMLLPYTKILLISIQSLVYLSCIYFFNRFS